MNVKRVLDSLNLDQIQTDLETHYHQTGPGRHPHIPLSMLKAQLAKHLLNIISDRRLALRLKHDRKVARACGFRRRTPSHGLFTHFRHRLGEETYVKIFNGLLRLPLACGGEPLRDQPHQDSGGYGEGVLVERRGGSDGGEGDDEGVRVPRLRLHRALHPPHRQEQGDRDEGPKLTHRLYFYQHTRLLLSLF